MREFNPPPYDPSTFDFDHFRTSTEEKLKPITEKYRAEQKRITRNYRLQVAAIWTTAAVAVAAVIYATKDMDN